MKIKKSVTEAVLAANRANAQASTGPNTIQGQSNSKRNAVRHGILTKAVQLETKEQRTEFQALVQTCSAQLDPQGVVEAFLVEEIAISLWKLSIVESIEARELIRRQGLSDNVDGVFGSFGKDLELPIADDDLPIDRGWDCERMVVRGVVGKHMGHFNATSGPGIVQGQVVNTSKKIFDSHERKTDHLEVEAVLVSALETMGRYKAKIKKDLYRAIETLRAVKAKSG